jgi:hypothetical protein
MAKIAGNKPERKWRYALREDYSYTSEHLQGIYFEHDYVRIADGVIALSEGYAWDGCSPTWYLPYLGWFGTPDGALNELSEPPTYYASCVHDAMCQFREEIDIDHQATVAVFKDLLIAGGAPALMVRLYPAAVSLLGPRRWKGRALGKPVS